MGEVEGSSGGSRGGICRAASPDGSGIGGSGGGFAARQVPTDRARRVEEMQE